MPSVPFLPKMQSSAGEKLLPKIAPDPRLIEHRLANGARILILPTASARSRPCAPVSLELWVLGGTAAERPQEHGCAHLLEHMVFKPTQWNGSALDIATAIESLGGDVNAYTSHDETVFHATVPASAVDEALPALMAPVLTPRFDREELRREIDVVIEEIKQYDDDLASRANQDLLAILFPEHGYGRPVLGRRGEVLQHDVRRLSAFHRALYTADRTVLVAVGPLDPSRLIAAAKPLLGALPRAGRRVADALVQPLRRPVVRVRSADAHEIHLVLGWVAPALPDGRACALDVASVVLGYGEASRLAVGTRRGSRLVTDAQAHFYASRWGSAVLISANTPSSRAEEATHAILDQVAALQSVPVDATELERAKAVLQSDIIYRHETVQGQAHALGYQLSLGGALQTEERYFEALERLTPEQVRQACAEFLAAERTAVSVIVPRDGSGPAPRALAASIRAALRKRPSSRRRTGLATRRGVSCIDLPCGLRVRAIVDRSVPMASGWLVWAGGLRGEQPRDLGCSPLIASLLTRGSKALDGDRLAHEIESVAASLEGFAGRNSLGLHFECLAPDVPMLLRRTLDCALQPTFDSDELEEERRVALEELAAEDDDPAGLAFREAYAVLYRGHPFARRRHGTHASLTRLRAERLHEVWRTSYPLGGACLGLAGDFDLERIVALLEALTPADAARLPATAEAATPRYPRRPTQRRLSRAKEQAHFVLAYPGLEMHDPAVYALDVLTTVLGGQVGCLFESLRERQGLVYNVSVSSLEGTDAGHVAVYAATSRRKLDRALASTRAELAAFCARGPRPGELDRAKAWLVAQHEVEMQRRSRVASQLAFDEVYGLGAGVHLRYPQAVMKVSRRALWDLANRLLTPDRCVESVVG